MAFDIIEIVLMVFLGAMMPHTRNVALPWDEASSEPLDATQLQLQRRVIGAHLHLIRGCAVFYAEKC